MRSRNPECPCCGDAPSLPPPADFDYEQFTGAPANDDGALCGIAVLPTEQRLAPGECLLPSVLFELETHTGRSHVESI